MYQTGSNPAHHVVAYYSLNGGGHWQPAIPTADTITTDLTSSPYSTATITYTHVYTWDIAASGFMGRSDNVVFRLVAIPSVKPRPNAVPGPFLHGAYATTSFPFRVRGTQVRVVDAASQAAQPGALVYRIDATAPVPGRPMSAATGVPFRTDSQGYLQGRGARAPGDRLLALLPITGTARYTLYHTSGHPSASGVDDFTVSQFGVQTLTVSAANPLLLLTLAASLEWDAANDATFLARLQQDLQKASSSLYDWTNGQVALGAITVYQAREQWEEADIRIYASNQVRPSANRGGIVSATLVLTSLQLTQPITATRGEIRIGAEWNRYGDAQVVGDDWPRVLAHELAHFAPLPRGLQRVALRPGSMGGRLRRLAGRAARLVADATGLPRPQAAAAFTCAPATGIVPLAVTCIDQSTGDVNAWQWDFGDGATSTVRNPSHTFAAAGAHTVSLVASGPGRQRRAHLPRLHHREQQRARKRRCAVCLYTKTCTLTAASVCRCPGAGTPTIGASTAPTVNCCGPTARANRTSYRCICTTTAAGASSATSATTRRRPPPPPGCAGRTRHGRRRTSRPPSVGWQLIPPMGGNVGHRWAQGWGSNGR